MGFFCKFFSPIVLESIKIDETAEVQRFRYVNCNSFPPPQPSGCCTGHPTEVTFSDLSYLYVGPRAVDPHSYFSDVFCSWRQKRLLGQFYSKKFEIKLQLLPVPISLIFSVIIFPSRIQEGKINADPRRSGFRQLTERVEAPADFGGLWISPLFVGLNNVIFVKYCTGTSWLGTLHYVYVKTFQIR